MQYANQKGKTVDFANNNEIYLDEYSDANRAAEELSRTGYYVVKCQTAEQRTKIDAFVKSEIFPYYIDQREYIFWLSYVDGNLQILPKGENVKKYFYYDYRSKSVRFDTPVNDSAAGPF